MKGVRARAVWMIGVGTMGRRTKEEEEADEVSSRSPPHSHWKLMNVRLGSLEDVSGGDVLLVHVVVDIVRSEPGKHDGGREAGGKPEVSSHPSLLSGRPYVASAETTERDRTHAPDAARTTFPATEAEGADRGVEEKACRWEAHEGTGEGEQSEM